MENIVNKNIDEISDKSFLNKKRKRKINKINKKTNDVIDNNNNDNLEEKINIIKTNDKNTKKVSKIKLVKHLEKNCRDYGDFSTFISFKSIDDILYLIYSDFASIISQNLLDFKIINVIKNAHILAISYFNYIFDEINKMDLILSGSIKDIKIWNVNNWQCLYDFNSLGKNFLSFYSTFLKDDNQCYIVIGKTISINDKQEYITIYDLKWEKIKEINDSQNDYPFYINNFYDNTFNKNYIITRNSDYIKSYDYNENKEYHIYRQESSFENMFFMIKKDEIIKLIVSGEKYIEIWNFHSGKLLTKINLFYSLNGLFLLLNNEYILYGCKNHKYLALLELKTGKSKHLLSFHNNNITTLKIINHPFYGECIISRGDRRDNINLWQVIC